MTKSDDATLGQELDWAALVLRIGVGVVFISGGVNKLVKLFGSATHDALVSTYVSPSGYINAFFFDYFFGGRFGDWATPSLFLTALSSFEVVTGILLVAGLFVRPISLIYGFLLWTFVMALPVTTTPGVVPWAKTYLSPAMLVQIRDIGLSGMMFVLYVLGSGARSLDYRLWQRDTARPRPQWDHAGLLLRLSVAVVFIVGGTFASMDHITSFATPPWILLILGLALAGCVGVRVAGYATAAVMLWYIFTKFNLDKGLIGNLNAVKREFAFLAAGVVLGRLGGGTAFSLTELWEKVRRGERLTYRP